jgi:hypothetical protein
MRSSPRIFTITVAAVVFSVGWANGGFAATAWGWIALLTSCAAAVVAARVGLTARRTLVAWWCALTGFVAWTALSLAWTPDMTAGVQDVERNLTYAAVAMLVVLTARVATAAAIRDGVLIGTGALCLYGLAQHLTPDVLGVASQAGVPGRLYSPLGYWNAQGMLAVFAMILAAGVVTSERSALSRAAAGAVIPLLGVQTFLTLSRGAELALVCGIVVWLVIDPGRVEATLWLLVVGPGAGLATWLAHRTPVLSGQGYGTAAAHAGHLLEAKVVLIGLATGCCIYGLAHLRPRVRVAPWLRSVYVGLVCAGALAGTVAVVHQHGSPLGWPGAAYRTLTAQPTVKQNDQSRLVTFSLTNRNYLWSAAWREGTTHPIAGGGAGSFDEYWYRTRPLIMDTSSAHSLYLETFAEEGAVGLVLLAITLFAPLVAGLRARFAPAVPSMIGALAAALLHAGTDWDWMVPGLMVPIILCSAALLVASADARSVVLTSGRRYALALAAGAVAMLSGLGLVGNQLLLNSYRAADRGDFRAAQHDATLASDWMPWSFLPWMQVGNARWALGDTSGARAAYAAAAAKEPGRAEPWIALAEVASGPQQMLAIRHERKVNPIGPETAMLCSIAPGGCD